MQTLLQFYSRLVLSFVHFYWICFVFPFPLDLIGMPFQLVEEKNQPEWLKAPAEYYNKGYFWVYTTRSDICKWVGPNVFNETVVIQMTGSGDTMRSYVGCFCAAVIAAGLALVWSLMMVFLRNTTIPAKADAWLHSIARVIVRFFLIQMLFGYGFAKVFPMQFAPPSTSRLTQPLGDMSPMGLLWTMMGYSTPYQMFTGGVEVLGGLLLISRRTTFLGALVTIGAMTQVFALNMCFDVPVKLYSFHYLIMGVYLAIPDLPRMFNVMVLGRAVEAKTYPPRLGSIAFDRFALIVRTLVVAAMLYGQISFGYKMWSDRYGGPAAPVQGNWEKVSLQIDGKDADPNDVLNWKSIDFNNKSMARFTGPKLPMLVYKTIWTPDNKKLELGKFTSPTWSATFHYDLPEPDKLILTGKMDGKAITATFKPGPEKKYELTSRGFRWVQEMPYNR